MLATTAQSLHSHRANLRPVGGSPFVVVRAEIYYLEDGERELLINGHPPMGAAEVAKCLGIRVQNLQHVKNLPDPVSHPAATRLWLGSEIEQFAKDHRRHRGEQ